MKLKLAHKIFITFSAMALMVVLLLIGLTWFKFSNNFAEYSNRIMLEKYYSVNVALAQEYQEAGSWNTLQDNSPAWQKILTKHLPQTVDSAEFKAVIAFKMHRFAVFNYLRQYVVGGPSKDPNTYTLEKISIDGKTVGWLGLHRNEYLSNPMAKGFIVQQLHGLYVIGGGILVLAAITALLLSRQMLKPIKELADGAHSLALRKFDTRINLQSSDELGQLAEDFNHTAKTLQQYESLRQQWISDISHELRTPLLILSGEIEALKDGVRELNTSAVESLYSEALHLGKIVNDLHELSLADTGALTIVKTFVQPVTALQETLAHFKPLLAKENISLIKNTEIDPAVTIVTDQTRLKQVFTNLLQNSLRYSDRPGVLNVAVEKDQHGVLISFEDSGPGVPEEDLPLLFDRLHRVDKSRNRERGGCGLGLSICRSIVHLLGGTIHASNGSQGGLKIQIRFPYPSDSSYE